MNKPAVAHFEEWIDQLLYKEVCVSDGNAPEQDQVKAQPLLLCPSAFARGVPLQRSVLELVPPTDLPGASGRQTSFIPPGASVSRHSPAGLL